MHRLLCGGCAIACKQTPACARVAFLTQACTHAYVRSPFVQEQMQEQLDMGSREVHIAHREEGMKGLEQDVTEVNGIFRDLHGLIVVHTHARKHARACTIPLAHALTYFYTPAHVCTHIQAATLSPAPLLAHYAWSDPLVPFPLLLPIHIDPGGKPEHNRRQHGHGRLEGSGRNQPAGHCGWVWVQEDDTPGRTCEGWTGTASTSPVAHPMGASNLSPWPVVKVGGVSLSSFRYSFG